MIAFCIVLTRKILRYSLGEAIFGLAFSIASCYQFCSTAIREWVGRSKKLFLARDSHGVILVNLNNTVLIASVR